jgi:hypothetical protein
MGWVMEKQQMLDQAKESLAPFETGNIVDLIQTLNLKSIMEHPLIMLLFLIFAFYAIVRRSKFVLLFLFASISIMLLVRYTLSPELVGGGLTIGSILPFAFCGLVIGGVLIYLTFIKHD